MAFLALFTLLATFLPATLALRGDMTFYTDLSNTDLSKGHCSFSTYQIPAGLYGMAIPSGLYDGSSNCGACAMVHYGGHDIMAMVVDECGGCPSNAQDIDLFPDGFSQLANQGVGRQSGVSWEWVDCHHPGNVWFHVLEGSSAEWFEVQAVNHNQPITSIQVSSDGGQTYSDMDRTPDNFFKARNTLTSDTVSIKAWIADGRDVVAHGARISGGSFDAGSNF